MNWRTLCIAAALTLPIGLSAAGDSELDRATMRGLKAVNVVIDEIDPQIPKAGVPSVELQVRIESRLKDAGILVDSAATEFVGLKIVGVRGSGGGVVVRGNQWALSFTIGLYQPVLLSRDRNVRTVTKTWEFETVVMADPKFLKQASIESADELAARFIAAFRSVNPSVPRP